MHHPSCVEEQPSFPPATLSRSSSSNQDETNELKACMFLPISAYRRHTHVPITGHDVWLQRNHSLPVVRCLYTFLAYSHVHVNEFRESTIDPGKRSARRCRPMHEIHCCTSGCLRSHFSNQKAPGCRIIPLIKKGTQPRLHFFDRHVNTQSPLRIDYSTGTENVFTEERISDTTHTSHLSAQLQKGGAAAPPTL